MVSASDIYEKLKAEFERLHRDGVARGEWVQFSNRLVEGIMKCQAIVIEHQKQMIQQTRDASTTEEYKAARQASKDAIQILDKLSELHQRTRAKIVP